MRTCAAPISGRDRSPVSRLRVATPPKFPPAYLTEYSLSADNLFTFLIDDHMRRAGGGNILVNTPDVLPI